MSFNGSGTFVINSSGQPVVTNTVISSTAFNALTADLGTGLSTTITKDGQTTTTAKIPFAFGLSAAAASNLAAGTVAAPGLYLSTDTGTGLYRIGANNYGVAVSGAKVLDISATGLGVTGTLTGSSSMLSPISAFLASNVALNNTANFFQGPSVAQGTVGTWFVTGTIVCRDTSGGFNVIAKLWDGTTTIVQSLTNTVGTNQYGTLTLSGFITSPAGNLRISVKSPSSTNNNIIGADSGGSGDSFITAIRIG